MTSRAWLLALVLAAVSTVMPAPAAAAVCMLPADYRADIRPDPEGVTTVVTMGIFVKDVTAIDDITQTIEGDFLVRKRWHDPRLEGLAGCRIHRSLVWFPITDVLNSTQLSRQRATVVTDQVQIGEGGLVTYYGQFFGKVATYHQLRQFPFDHQRFRIRMVALQFPASELHVVLDKQFTGIADELNIADWTIDGAETEAGDQLLADYNATYSVMTLFILASRNSDYYVWKVLLPLLLIVIMSFVVFWIDPERFGSQISISVMSMLTLIAFQFALTTTLPKVGYFTLLDKLILGSTLLVFGALIEATVSSVLVMRGKAPFAHRIDYVCRWLFPIALVTIWGAVLL